MPISSILAIGDTTVDAFLSIQNASTECRVDELTKELCVKFGEKITVDQCTLSIGGNAANVAVGISRLGVQTGLVTEVGDNSLASLIISALTKENIDRTYVLQIPHTDSSLSIGINFQGDRTLFVEHVKRLNNFPYDHMANIHLVYLTSLGHDWEHAYLDALEMVKKNGAKLALNPGSLQLHEGRETLSKVLERTDLLFVNKEEGEKIMGSKFTDVIELMVGLQTLGPKMIIITDGPRGAFVLDENRKNYFQEAIPVKIVEKTGAGDAFTAGFLSAWYTGKGIEESMLWGARNAASVIGKVGAQAGLLTKSEIDIQEIRKTNMLYILPFDHRHTFAEKLYHVETLSQEQEAEIREFKQIIYDGFVASISNGSVAKENGAILVDEQYGDAVLRHAKLDGFTSILTIEKSGGNGLEFAYGEQFADHIDRYKPTYTKILIRYNPDDSAESKQQQIEKLKIISDYSHTHGYKFLLEPLIPASVAQLQQVNNDKNTYDTTIRPDLTIKMMAELQAAGIEVDIWKLEGFDAKEAYEKCVAQARINGRNDVGIVVLGRGAGTKTVENWLRIGASVDGVVGFAVGRTVFWNVIAAYHAKIANREETVKIISENFTHFCNVFEEGRKK